MSLTSPRCASLDFFESWACARVRSLRIIAHRIGYDVTYICGLWKEVSGQPSATRRRACQGYAKLHENTAGALLSSSVNTPKTPTLQTGHKPLAAACRPSHQSTECEKMTVRYISPRCNVSSHTRPELSTARRSRAFTRGDWARVLRTCGREFLSAGSEIIDFMPDADCGAWYNIMSDGSAGICMAGLSG